MTGNGREITGEFVFGLVESAIGKEATEILLTPVQELNMVRVDFGLLHCYYRQPEITRAQLAYLAIYLVLIGNVAAGGAPDGEPAVVIYIEPVHPTNGRQQPQAAKIDEP